MLKKGHQSVEGVEVSCKNIFLELYGKEK